MIHSIVGLMNSGKTLYMTWLLYQEYLNGRTIITNYNVNFPHYKINKDFLLDLGKREFVLENVALGLDELWIWLDSRSAMSEENRVATYMFLQSSKDDTKIFLTAQDNSQNEKRLKDNMHKMSICSRVLLTNNKFKKISSEYRFLKPEWQDVLYIKIKTFEKRNYYIFTDWFPTHEKLFIRAKDVFPLYNTKQKIRMQEVKKV